ncbi:MAG: MgtC/SapB family protein [Novosphingobium sp.]
MPDFAQPPDLLQPPDFVLPVAAGSTEVLSGQMLSGQISAALAAAVLAGLIVGVERGWAQREMPAGGRVAGIRTFGILGLTGGLSGLLPDAAMAVLLAGAALVIASGYRSAVRGDQLSATSALAALLTLAIGCVATRLSPMLGLGTAAASFALLRARHTLHAVLRGLDEREIEAVARFLLVALVVLPLLPDADFGPYGAWNPRKIWLVVVMVTGLSFAGYVLARRIGPGRGIMIVALTGALVSRPR